MVEKIKVKTMKCLVGTIKENLSDLNLGKIFFVKTQESKNHKRRKR